MPVTPQITVTGTLADLFGAVVPNGSLVFQLCGYGSAIPRIYGTAIIASTSPNKKAVSGAGAFSVELWGNDVIIPANTYYTIQILDDNGNVIQTNAYQFTGAGSFDLSTVAPYIPFVPAVPPASAPGTLDVVVAYIVNPIFDALNTAGIIEFEMTLTGNVTNPTLIHLTPGQIVSFLFQQDGVGGRTVAWPAAVKGAGIVDPTANAISVQSFLVRSDGNLYPIGPMTVS